MSIWFKVDLDSPHSWSSMTETSESWKCGFLVRELPRNSVDFRQFCSWRSSERRDVIDTWTDRLPSEFWAQSDGILTFSGSTSLCHISSPSLEHDLGSEVLLLGGVVAHPHLQHPLWLHHLYVLHVSRFLMEAVAYERERQRRSMSWCVQEHFLLTVIMKSKHKGELFPRHSLRSGWKIRTRRKETFLSRVEVFYHLSFPHPYFHDPELN